MIRHGRTGALARQTRPFGTAVSLHAHTWYSAEPLTFIPQYAARIPVIRGCLARELAGYRERAGRTVDFSRAFWRPPLAPHEVRRSELEQIQQLDLHGLVSITDHDNIQAGQLLRAGGVDHDAPVSFEWTIRFRETEFHVGVHNLPPAEATATFRELAAFTAGASKAALADLLTGIGEHPGSLVVLNHPFWDLIAAGTSRHRENLLAFLEAHRHGIHALEVNGYRTAAENGSVLELARQVALPAVSGGDRHGRLPNAVLNLTRAATFDEFVAEVRTERRSEILLMPAYREPLGVRKLLCASDILRDDPDHAYGCRAWTQRIFYQDGGPILPLCEHWPGGPPAWLNRLVRSVVLSRWPLTHASRALPLPVAALRDRRDTHSHLDAAAP